MTRPKLASTLVNTRPAEWVERVEMLDRREIPPAALVRRIVEAGGRLPGLILLGAAGFQARYADLVAAAILARRREPPRIVISDATWQVGSAALRRLLPGSPSLERPARAAIRALDGPHVTYCVLSSEERREFPERWGVPPERVVFTPFCVTMTDEELDGPVDEPGGVFAGGNPLRDYGTLLRAARGLTERVTIATTAIDGPTPPNVTAGPLPHERFVAELRSARVVVVPLQPGLGRSAGQQTYLNAMALGKPVVVTDAPGVRDHVADGETGVVVPPGDPAAMRAAIERLLDDPGEIGERARADVRERFTLDRYLRSLLAVADSAIAGESPSAEPDRALLPSNAASSSRALRSSS
jgi:glycosyl transferase family 1